MINNNVLEEFFVWEEKNSIDQNQNLLKNEKQDNSVITIETKTDSMPKDWRDITDPKLREKMRKKENKKRHYQKHRDHIRQQAKSYRNNNKDKVRTLHREASKRYREKYPNKVKAYRKDYYETKEKTDLMIREKNKVRCKDYYENNKEREKIKNKAYRKRDSVKKQRNERDRLRRKNDIQYRLNFMLRKRLSTAIKNNQKSGSAVKDLGCTIEELKQYLESKFSPGMTWDNHGLNGWHIDHIKPLASFDLKDRKQLLEACHYTNLQPLWAKDNLYKSDKI